MMTSVRTVGLQADMLSRDPPYHSLLKTIDIFKTNKLGEEGVIVEIGCNRSPLSYSLYEESEKRNLDLDGHSTAYLLDTGTDFTSVDINESHCNIARRDLQKLFPERKNWRLLCMDGIEYLRNVSMPISFLFLDAWDLDSVDSAQQHLEALKAALPKMSAKSLVLIDDTDLDFIPEKKHFVWACGTSGKGRLAIPYALEAGYHVVYSGRQTLLARGVAC